MQSHQMYKVQAKLDKPIAVENLHTALVNHGAENIIYASSNLKLEYSIDEKHLDESVRFLFQTGYFTNVEAYPVTIYKLAHRDISLPYGGSQKKLFCRVREYIWNGSIMKIEVLEEDLDLLSQQTGFSREAIRGDIMKKWTLWNKTDSL